MKQDTDKIWRDKLGGASPEDLINHFEEEEMWRQIQHKLAPEKNGKKFPSLRYWPYAAMLALGLFLGFYFKNNKTQERIYVQKVITKQTVTDTVFVEKSLAQKPENIITAPDKRVPQAKPAVGTILEQEAQKSLAHESVVEPPSSSEEDPVAKAEQKEIVVVYWDELQSAKEHQKNLVVKRKKRGFIELNKSNEGERSSQELPIRSLLFASNN